MTDVQEDTSNASTEESDEKNELDDLEASFDDGVSFEDGEDESTDSEQAESSTDDEDKADVEDDSEESVDDEPPTDQQVDESSSSVEQAEEDTASKDESTVDEKVDKEVQKRLNDEYAKRRIAEREARKANQEATIQQYLREAGDDADELAKRQLEVEAFNIQQQKVQINEEKLQVGLNRAIAEIDLFKTGDKEIKELLASELDDFEAMFVVKDRDGRPLEVKSDVYQYLKNKADSFNRIAGIGAKAEAKGKARVKSTVMPLPRQTPKEPPSDPGLDAFDEEADRW